MNPDRELRDTISIFLGGIAIIIPVIIFFIDSPNKINPTTIMIFIGIGVTTLIISIYAFISSRWKGIEKNVSKNNNEIIEIKKSLNYKSIINDMEVRLRVLELLKDKKGAIDPKIIGWVLVGILLYLFLKSIGIFS